MEDSGKPVDQVRAELARLRSRDLRFADGRILGSMCTEPHPVAVEAYRAFLESNLGDPWLSPGAKELEDRALALLLGLLSGPEGSGGVFVSGGSEANFTALLIARRKTGRREVVLPESAHFSFEKACAYLGMVPRYAKTRDDGSVDVEALRGLTGPATAAVVGVAGTTELGAIDDVPALAEVARDAGAHLHVDAAFGGFVIPFAKRLGRRIPDFDLGVEGVASVAIDPHKMGLAPIPAGVLAVSDRADLTAVAIASPYVSVERQSTMQGTRSGAAAAATWAVMTHLGREGYTRIVRSALDVTERLASGLRSLGVPLVREPILNVVAFRVSDPALVRRLLADQGFLVALAPLSRGLKVVVMPHVTAGAVDAFLAALAPILAKTGDRAGAP